MSPNELKTIYKRLYKFSIQSNNLVYESIYVNIDCELASDTQSKLQNFDNIAKKIGSFNLYCI